MSKKEQILALRDECMTHMEIAKAVGTSHQYVAMILSQQDPRYFRFITTPSPYPNFKNWMNENRISRHELLRRMGIAVHPTNVSTINRVLRGEADPRKSYIDRLIKATGMDYETLFAKEGED